MLKNLDIERCGPGGHLASASNGPVSTTPRYARQREQFGQPIVRFQAVSHKLADMYIRHRAADNLVYERPWRGQGRARPEALGRGQGLRQRVPPLVRPSTPSRSWAATATSGSSPSSD